MGWQDAPIVGGAAQGDSQPAWMNAPIVGDEQPSMAQPTPPQQSANPMNYLSLMGRGLAELPMGVAQAYGDFAEPSPKPVNESLADLNPSNPLDILKALAGSTPGQISQAVSDVQSRTNQIQEQTPYGAAARVVPQIAQTLGIPAARTIAGGAGIGAGMGALQPVVGDSAASRNQDRVINTGLGATLGAVGTKVGQMIGGIGKPAAKSAEEIKKASSQAYAAAAAKGATIPAKLTDKFVSEIEGLKPKAIAGKVLPSIDEKITKLIDEYAPLKGSNLSFDDVQRIDESLGDAVDAALENGIVGKAAKKVLDIQTRFREIIDDGTVGIPALKEARNLWSQGARMADIEKIITRAELSDNPATALKSGFRALYANPARLRGFDKEQRELIKKAATSGVVGDALRTMGSRLVPIVTLGAGGGVAPTIGAQVGSTLARKGAERAQMGRAEDIVRSISEKALPAQRGALGKVSEFIGDTTQKLGRGAIPYAAQPAVQTPPVTLPGATEPSAMDVTPLEAMQPALPEVAPQSSVESIIKSAAQIAGISPELHLANAKTESSLNPNAKSPTSSAFGLHQIIKPTWREIVKRHGKQYDLKMSDIYVPEKNSLGAALLTKDNIEVLSKALGREVTAGESYIAHFMGARGAAMLLKADPNKPAAKLFPAAAKANRSIFFDGRRPRTNGELAYLLASKVEQRMPQEEPAPIAPPVPEEPSVDVAHIPLGAAEELRKNPQLVPQFEEVFGRGTAKKILET